MLAAAVFVSSFRDFVADDTAGNSGRGADTSRGRDGHARDLDDETLCERLRGADQSALKVLMERHAPMVMRLAMNVLSDRGEAEDVVQEVFIAVWKHREAWIATGARFSTWLHRIAINKAIDKRRARRASPEPQDYITAACDAAAAHQTVWEQAAHLDRQDTSRRLDAELARLPAAQARALRLFYFEGRDVPAIAALMGGSEQSVRSLLKRGRQALRTRLAKRRKPSDDALTVQDAGRPVRPHRR